MHPVPPSPNGSLSARQARIVLLLLTIVGSALAVVSFSPLKQGFADRPSRGRGDIDLYQAEIDRIHQGEAYYDVVASELGEFGYPRHSVFNWRTPLPVWLLAKLPDLAWGKGILLAAALGLVLIAFGWLAHEGTTGQGLLAVLLLVGGLLPCGLGNLLVMSEIWAGVLLALSIAAYGTERRVLGGIAGLAALFVRELAAPYYLLTLFWSIRERRYRETLLLLFGLSGYALFYALHLEQVVARQPAEDGALASHWIAWGGAGFMLSAAQMNVFLLLLPQIVTALYLAVALAGFASWRSEGGRRAATTALVYLALFGVVGQPVNQYWGSQIAPLLCLGAARGPGQIISLWRTARLSTESAATKLEPAAR